MGHQIFVSHSSKDQPSANATVAFLERNGIGCWVAPRNIVPGANLAESIPSAIAEAKLMVLIFSGHANAAPHIRRLVERAVRQGLTIIALRIADVALSAELAPLLGSARWINAIAPPLEDHLRELTETINTTLNPPASTFVTAPLDVVPSTVILPVVDSPGVSVALISAALRAPVEKPKRAWLWVALAAATMLVAASVVEVVHFNRTPAASIATSRFAPTMMPTIDVARDQAAKALAARQAHIDDLLANARANDNEDHDTIALSALDELLKLDPGNAIAMQLHDKISQYAPAKKQRLEQQAAARADADRKAKIDSLLAIATDNVENGHASDGRAALEELLTLDPQNVAALSLRERIDNNLKATNSLGMTLVYIPAGTFLMGSPAEEAGRSDDELQHSVTLTKPFFMAATPVTQAQWEAVMGSRPSNFQGDNLPVEQVSYDEAAEFCRKLSVKENKHYRLPTEAEWEYACRAGTNTPYNTGSDENALGEAGWYSANSGGQTHPVGQKQHNAWGLYDMHGNVWQWCSDWYGTYPNGQTTDPRGAATVRDRVLRGGSWHDPAQRCRSARRRYSAPDAHYYSIGFRVVMVP